MTPMQVLAVASEIYPLVKTGGLADVAGALPKALKAEGIETITLVPGYPDVLSALVEADEVLSLPEILRWGGARAAQFRRRIWNCSYSTRRIYLRVPETPMWRPTAPTGPIMPFVTLRWGEPPPRSARVRFRNLRRRSFTPTTGRPD